MTTPRNRPRPVAWRVAARGHGRPRSWVGPPQLALALAVVSLLVAAAPDDPTEAPSATKVLGCLVERELPSPAGQATAGGFAFSFQSLGGLAEDGRSCTVYRLRNAAGSPPTPVRWLAGEEVLVDVARLRRCGTQSQVECGWFEVARYFDGDIDGGRTQLAFGLNADSFRVENDGLVARTDPDLGATNASVGTEIVGTLTLADGSEVGLDLIVKSRFERRAGAIELIYEVSAADPRLLSGESVAMIWQHRGGVPGDGAEGGLRPPASGAGAFAPFLALPGQSGEGHQALEATRRGDTVAVRRSVAELAYAPDLRLDFVEPGRPEVVLLSVPLPAFVPLDP